MAVVSVKILVRKAQLYGHTVKLVKVSPTEAYMIAYSPFFRCPVAYKIMTSNHVSPRYAQRIFHRYFG